VPDLRFNFYRCRYMLKTVFDSCPLLYRGQRKIDNPTQSWPARSSLRA
jgi:hypothetical protein